MSGAIYFMTKYGSTEEYARWLAEDTGLPAFNIEHAVPAISEQDFIVLVTPIYYYRPLMLKWMKEHLVALGEKPIVFVTVSGAAGGDKLDSWLRDSLSPDFVAKIQHVAVRGRQRPQDLSWFHWIMLKFAAAVNSDKQAAKEEAEGFDYMDRESIAPAVALIERLKTREPA